MKNNSVNILQGKVNIDLYLLFYKIKSILTHIVKNAYIC